MQQSKDTRRRPSGVLLWAAPVGLMGVLGASLGGCAEEARSSGYERSEKALRDPMDYSPGFKKPDRDMTGPPDAGRAGTGSEGDDNGLMRDLDHVFNP